MPDTFNWAGSQHAQFQGLLADIRTNPEDSGLRLILADWLLEHADLLPGELVHIVDVTNGARLETYTIAGERGSGVIGINGAAARLVHPGDVVILIGYGQMETAEAKDHKPHVVFVDADNNIMATGYDPAETFGDKSLTRGDLIAG